MMIVALALYLAATNLIAFGAFALDKRAAQRRERRVPENTLLMIAAVGGTPGAIAGQQMLRHKTRKEPFRTVLWLIVGAQALALAYLAWRFM